MSKDRKQIEEQALDALLIEALGQVEPPDLTTPILNKLSHRDGHQEVGTIVAAPTRAKPVSNAPSAGRHAVAWTLALTAAVAASILMVVWIRGDSEADKGALIAANESNSPDAPQLATTGTDVTPETDSDDAPSLPPRGIPLVMDPTTESTREPSPDESVNQPAVPGPVQAVTLVSKQFDSELVSYWKAIGIEPAAEADSEVVVSRLASILGVTLPSEAVSDPIRLQEELADEEVARKVALRWLQQMTERGVQRIDEESRDQLTNELAACIQGKQPFDQTVAGWISGQSPLSSSFYSAISHSGRDAMARRLAAMTMNVDLRCIRCHDAKIEGSGVQQDYWGFAALLSRGVSRDAEGHVTIDPEPAKNNELFYELPDGRQRLAEPLVSKRWIESPASPTAESVKAWSDQLVGSEAMARGAVNSLWQLIHGQPLRGRVVDPITAPHNEALDRVEDQLVQDLVDSQFNVARTLSLIIASQATRRSVPEELLPENALVVSEPDRRKAINAVNAFAAALPRPAALSLSKRLDQTMRAIGGKLDQDGRPLLAQIGDSSDQSPGVNEGPAATPLAVDFPVRSESLPVQWLTLIEDEEDQIDHLGYLAGMPRLPENVRAAAKAMQDDERVSKELMLNRVWWLIRP